MSVEAPAVSELSDLQVHLTGIKYYFSILVIICPTDISIVNIWIFLCRIKDIYIYIYIYISISIYIYIYIYKIHGVICRDQHYEEI